MKVWLIYKGAGKVFSQFDTQTFKLQIKIFSSRCIANLFDQQYLQKVLVDLLEFLLGNNQQRNDKSKANTSSWVWPDLPTHTQITWNFPEGSLDNLRGGVNLKDFRKWNFNIFYIQKHKLYHQNGFNQIAGIFGRNHCVFKFLRHIHYLKKDKSEPIRRVWLGIPSHSQNFWDFPLVFFGHPRGEVRLRIVQNER